jgi:hypothetical protein
MGDANGRLRGGGGGEKTALFLSFGVEKKWLTNHFN